MATTIPQITELDLNPVVVEPVGTVAVDVRARLAQVAAASDPYLRRLS